MVTNSGDHQPHIYSPEEFKGKFACGRCPGLPGILKWTSLHLLPICHIDVCTFKDSSCNDIIDKITFRESEQLQWVVYEIAPMQIAASSELGSHSIGRTWNTRYLDTTLLRQWLTACDIRHGPEFHTPVTPRPDHHILLIDTRRLCLVCSHGDEAYAALSYVWGGTTMFRTTRRNRNILKEEGALNKVHNPPIPATVKDAILLAAEIGLPYIWIDSLCIVQDDEDSRNIHLSSMAAIYANAHLTIVAAAGKIADHGIPGVPGGSRTRDKPCHIIRTDSDLRWVVEPIFYDWSHGSIWTTRGWQVNVPYRDRGIH
jgi:hypothetical protein